MVLSGVIVLKFVQCIVQTSGAFSLGLLFNREEIILNSNSPQFYIFNGIVCALCLLTRLTLGIFSINEYQEEEEEEDNNNNSSVLNSHYLHALFCISSGVLSFTVVNTLVFVHQGGPYVLVILLLYVALPYVVSCYWGCIFYASTPNNCIKSVCVFVWFFCGLLLSPYFSYTAVGISFIISSLATLFSFKSADEASFFLSERTQSSPSSSPQKGFQSLELLIAGGVFYGATHISNLESILLSVGIVCILSPLSMLLYYALDNPRWLKLVGFVLCALGLNSVPEVALAGVCVFGPILWDSMIGSQEKRNSKACLVLAIFTGTRLIPDHSLLGYPWWVDNLVVGGVVFVSIAYEIALWWVWRPATERGIIYVESNLEDEEKTYATTLEEGGGEEIGYIFNIEDESEGDIELQEI